MAISRHTFMYTHSCMYIFIYIYIHTYIYRERDSYTYVYIHAEYISATSMNTCLIHSCYLSMCTYIYTRI